MHELPEPVRIVLKTQTGDAVLVVDCDYRIVYWDDRMESLTGTLAEEVMGERSRCYKENWRGVVPSAPTDVQTERKVD